MSAGRDFYAKCPEPILVGLARKGDRDAFAQLVRLRQSWIRNLMRRCCSDPTLADDLAQQTFLRAWRRIRQVKRPDRFGGWLKRVAVNVWLQHASKNDPLKNADDADAWDDAAPARNDVVAAGIDLDRALASLPAHPRLCLVLSYHEGMTHEEIAEVANIPAGTVKSHIRRGAQRLRARLSAYDRAPAGKGEA